MTHDSGGDLAAIDPGAAGQRMRSKREGGAEIRSMPGEQLWEWTHKDYPRTLARVSQGSWHDAFIQIGPCCPPAPPEWALQPGAAFGCRPARHAHRAHQTHQVHLGLGQGSEPLLTPRAASSRPGIAAGEGACGDATTPTARNSIFPKPTHNKGWRPRRK